MEDAWRECMQEFARQAAERIDKMMMERYSMRPRYKFITVSAGVEKGPSIDYKLLEIMPGHEKGN